MALEPDAVEIRVLGCLIEKQRTTPDAYPLSLNALRLACNQSSNRDPVVEYDEPTIRAALHRLASRRWARLASRQGSRAVKYRHLLDEALGLSDDELAVVCLLLLRGPQTPGELKQRTERLHPFPGLAAVEDTLDRLAGRGHVARLERRPGQKEERYAQLLGGGEDAGPASDDAPGARAPAGRTTNRAELAAGSELAAGPGLAAGTGEGIAARVDGLAAEVAALREEVEALRRELGA